MSTDFCLSVLELLVLSELAPDCKLSLNEASQCVGLLDVGGVSW